MTSLLQRLRERKLFQWALAYLAGAWVLFQGIEVMAEPWGLSPGLQRTIHLLVAVGFLVALVLAFLRLPERISVHYVARFAIVCYNVVRNSARLRKVDLSGVPFSATLENRAAA
jgi:hypothetical protein